MKYSVLALLLSSNSLYASDYASELSTSAFAVVCMAAFGVPDDSDYLLEVQKTIIDLEQSGGSDKVISFYEELIDKILNNEQLDYDIRTSMANSIRQQLSCYKAAILDQAEKTE